MELGTAINSHYVQHELRVVSRGAESNDVRGRLSRRHSYQSLVVTSSRSYLLMTAPSSQERYKSRCWLLYCSLAGWFYGRCLFPQFTEREARVLSLRSNPRQLSNVLRYVSINLNKHEFRSILPDPRPNADKRYYAASCATLHQASPSTQTARACITCQTTKLPLR